MKKETEVRYWEKNPVINGIFDKVCDEIYINIDKISEPYLKDIRFYLENKGMIGNVEPCQRWADLHELICNYAICRDYLAFERGFKTAVRLLTECEIEGVQNVIKD